MGCQLTTSYGCTVMPIAAPINEAPKKKTRTLLPVLTILFLFSYGLMTLLIVEQGRAIQSQHNVIEVLMRDSTELWSAKGKALNQKAADARAQSAQGPSADASADKATASQTPPSQAQSKKQSNSARSSQSHAGKAKPGLQLPPMPAADLADQRRSLRTI